MLALVIVTVSAAVVFDFTNGLHDTANAMATTIATRPLPRGQPRRQRVARSPEAFAGAGPCCGRLPPHPREEDAF